MLETNSFIYILFSFLVINIFIMWGAFWGARYRWSILSNYCFEIFNQENEIKDIAFIINEYKYKYFLSFIFYGILNYLSFIIFIWLMIYFHFEENIILLLIPMIIIFLFSNILFFIILKIYNKELKKIGVYSKKEATANFLKFQAELDIEKVIKFTIVKNKNSNIQNVRFQYQQKNFYKKIKKIIKQKNQKDYDLKLLMAFSKYLQIYGFFLTRIKKSREINQYQIFIEDNQNYDSLYALNKILINNFFAYVEQAQKETK